MLEYFICIGIYLIPFIILIILLIFKAFSINSVNLQRITDRISDSYIVLNNKNNVIDFNKTFLLTFLIDSIKLKNTNLFSFLKTSTNEINLDELKTLLDKVKISSDTIYLKKYFKYINKHFNIEINTISTKKKKYLGTLILFKDTTQHLKDLETIKNNQDTLIKQERLASLGQMIGGITHNLKTPIMSIAGATEGLNDLIKEYDSSIDDPEVNSEDHHQITKEMTEWIIKIKTYLSYMSDVITAVKGQAVALSTNTIGSFSIEELMKNVEILMKHELKNALIVLTMKTEVDPLTHISGDITSLVQVLTNIISNAIQAYNGKTNEILEVTIYKEKSNIVLKIKDYAGGLPEVVKDKIFKEMITTKGKNGTGLGLYMAYSTIRAHFNGNITFESDTGKGTTFFISIPL